jgi:hypothetical protein
MATNPQGLLGRLKGIIDDVVIVAIIIVCPAIVLVIAWRMVEHQAHYPPTLISTFLGIMVAALTYRFLGGTGEIEFKLGALKLAGSAALLLAVALIMGDRFRTENRLYEDRGQHDRDMQPTKDELDEKRGTVKALSNELNKVKSEKEKLAQQLEASRGQLVDSVRKLPLDDAAAGELRAMARAGENPFVTELRQLQARVVVNGSVAAKGTYNICPDFFSKLYPTAPNPEIVVRRVAVDGTPTQVKLTNRQNLDLDFCKKLDRPLDLQMSCIDGLELFPDLIASCEGRVPRFRQEFGYREVTIGAVAR